MSNARTVETFCAAFYRNLQVKPLEPDDRRYVSLEDLQHSLEADPIHRLRRCMDWSASSVQLFSGYRGSGKSTELRRLRRDLESSGYMVVLCDMRDYIHDTMPVDISELLVSVAGAFGEGLRAEHLLGKDAGQISYWDRFVGFLKTEIQIESVGLQGIKAGLRNDPDFKQRFQQLMKTRLSPLVADVRGFMVDCVKRLRRRHGDDRKVVMLVDSMEHLRGTSANASEVHASLENIFAGHNDKLGFQSMHVVYTVPPWLKVRSPGIEAHFSGGEILPCVKIRDPRSGEPYEPGLRGLTDVVQRRGDWQRLLRGGEALEQLLLASGGYLRDLFRMFQGVLLLADQRKTLPVDQDAVELAIADARSDYLPISTADALWLDRVARTHRTELGHNAELGDLARFWDTHLILCYRNRDEWYDVHPLIRETVQQQAAQASTERTGGATS